MSLLSPLQRGPLNPRTPCSSMAATPGSPLWPGLWSDQDLSGQHLAVPRPARPSSTGQAAAARRPAEQPHCHQNASVTQLKISKAGDLRTLAELRLHERFPNAASITLYDSSSDTPACGVEQLTDFALLTLSRLPSLARLVIYSCAGLRGSSAAQALTLCPQLQDLTMPRGGWPAKAATYSCVPTEGMPLNGNRPSYVHAASQLPHLLTTSRLQRAPQTPPATSWAR
jgi:hypothetical protein